MSNITVEFINDENKNKHIRTIISWLESDFNKKGSPGHHFWHNKDLIEESFDNFEAMVALNDLNEVVGYMIWRIHNTSQAEINIIEVREDFRNRGIFKKMLSEFSNKLTDVRVLSASVIPKAEATFVKAGWESVHVPRMPKKHIKIIRPGLSPSDTLPNGHVIAVCSEGDCYQVLKNKDEYKQVTKYFQINLNEKGELAEPIITDFYYEGYIGVYLNKELIAEGKARHLFKDTTCYNNLNLLIINRIKPCNPELFIEKGFFSQSKSLSEERQESCSTEGGTSLLGDVNDEPRSKRQRVELKDEAKNLSTSQEVTKIQEINDDTGIDIAYSTAQLLSQSSPFMFSSMPQIQSTNLPSQNSAQEQKFSFEHKQT